MRPAARWVAVALLCASARGWAEEKPLTSAAPSLDFNLDDAPVDPGQARAEAEATAAAAAVQAQVSTRRTVLTVHQGLGLLTLAGLGATTVVGQIEFNDKYRAGGDSERWLPLHVGLVITTSALFATVGMLGVLAPVPFEKKLRLDTSTIHKALMTLATVGMIAQLVLGLIMAPRDGQLAQVDLAAAHQIIGYSTLGAMSAGALVWLF